jgi:hypothetical protein
MLQPIDEGAEDPKEDYSRNDRQPSLLIWLELHEGISF